MRRYSLKSSLLILATLCVLPSAAINAWLLYSNFDLRRSQAHESTLLVARQVVADFDSEMSAIEAALKVLASAPELQSGDLRRFQERARGALVAGTVYNYILTNRAGHQVMNTLLPYGTALPTSGTPAQLDRVFATGETVLTDLFVGPVTRQPAIAMGVPVHVHGEVIYSLNIGLSPTRINDLLKRQALPDNWLIAVLDQSGTIVGRSHDADRYVGEKGVPVLREAMTRQTELSLRIHSVDGIPTFAGLKPSPRWHWAVVVGQHEATLYARVEPMVVRVLLGTALALGTGLLLALWLARRVLTTMHDINHSAKALSRGEPFVLPDVQFREAEALGDALQLASQAMAQVTFQSQHDALTGLPNRAMFREFAERQLRLAQRNAQGLAVVAIDLDHFKDVNDLQGHAAGDEVLVAAARRIEQAVRSSDMAARLGGDEFVVLLSETDPATAIQTAHRMVDALNQPYTTTSCPVTGSAGVALYPQDGTTLDALSRAADGALYAAKSAGRARVKTAGGDEQRMTMAPSNSPA
jgi:diguanylate cyclase (GGDEF)-like protein